MSDVFIRIDGRVALPLLQWLLQELRTMEQTAPDEIHLAISINDSNESMLDHLKMLNSLQPELPIQNFIRTEELTEEQKKAHAWFLKIGKE